MLAANARANISVTIEHKDSSEGAPSFVFTNVPPPDRSGGAPGTFAVIDGQEDANSGGVGVLNDGLTPAHFDEPGDNFFFAAGTPGGRLRLDLKTVTAIEQINTFSCHPGSRAPQVYTLYGATGAETNFNKSPRQGMAPASAGWMLIASVDTRPASGGPGGEYGVSIRDASGLVGKFRYLLFDCAATETDDDFGNTFYSEINVLPVGGHIVTNAPVVKPFVVHSPDGRYEITIDAAKAPALAGWATNTLAPVVADWYPKIVALLPSDGYEAPRKLSIALRPGGGAAATTSGTRITGNATWLKGQLHGEAVGCFIHEMVHVVQSYGTRHRENPGYLVEGIADYVRWYKFEPQSHGAEISRRRLDSANFDASYRVTANFLNWVNTKYGGTVVAQLNAALREGRYTSEFWTKATGQDVEHLNAAWKADLRQKLATPGQ